MIAYEIFKGVKARTISSDAAMRGALREMLRRDIPLSAGWIDVKAALSLYRIMGASGKYSSLDQSGVM